VFVNSIFQELILAIVILHTYLYSFHVQKLICCFDRYADFVFTKDLYHEVTHSSPMFSLDCEMCRTTSGELEVTRISIVNEQLEVCASFLTVTTSQMRYFFANEAIQLIFECRSHLTFPVLQSPLRVFQIIYCHSLLSLI
jgi:hypothetical protein